MDPELDTLDPATSAVLEPNNDIPDLTLPDEESSAPPPQQQEEDQPDVHEGLASIFANPKDLWRYRVARANGATEQEALKVGDNGVGKWGDVTATYKVPMVALPKDTPGARPGRLVQVDGPKGPVIAKIADEMPATGDLLGKATIDLNPAAALAVGHNGGLTPVKWQFADQGTLSQQGGQPAQTGDLTGDELATESGVLPTDLGVDESQLTPIGTQSQANQIDPTINNQAFGQWFKNLKPKKPNADGSMTMDDGSIVYRDLSVVFERGGQRYIRTADGTIKPLPKAAATPVPDIPIPEGAMGEAALEGLTDTQKSLARQIAFYRLPISRYLAISRNPQYAQILARVPYLNPQFNEVPGEYERRSKLVNDFTSGKTAVNRRSINQLVGHMDELSHAADDLGNDQNQVVNWVMNKYRELTGDPRPARFETAATAVESELATVFKGAGATDQEIKQWRERFKISQSPEQMKAVLDEGLKLMSSRLGAIQGQWQSVMGENSKYPILDKRSESILKRFGHEDIIEQNGGYDEKADAQEQPTPTATPAKEKPSKEEIVAEARDRLKKNPNDDKARAVLELVGEL